MAREVSDCSALRGVLLSPNRKDEINPLPWAAAPGWALEALEAVGAVGTGGIRQGQEGGSCLALLCGPDKTQHLESSTFHNLLLFCTWNQPWILGRGSPCAAVGTGPWGHGSHHQSEKCPSIIFCLCFVLLSPDCRNEELLPTWKVPAFPNFRTLWKWETYRKKLLLFFIYCGKNLDLRNGLHTVPRKNSCSVYISWKFKPIFLLLCNSN